MTDLLPFIHTSLQAAMNLAVAEAAYQFEHRDLHIGNVLVRRTHANRCTARLEGQQIEIHTEGLHVVLIDFSLSRIESGEMTIFKDLALEPEIFDGPSGDLQVRIAVGCLTAVWMSG